MSPVRRLLAFNRPTAGRLALAAGAGAGASACAVGLLATSAWLIARAAEHPPVLELGVAIAGVRAFALLRGGLRYGERLAGHDAALRVLGTVRVRVYTALARVVPGGRAPSRGDLLSRFATDVDTGVDLLARAVLPYAAAVLAGAGAVVLFAALLPPAAAVLGLALAGYLVAVPAVQGALGRRADAAMARRRGERSESIVDMIQGLDEVVTYGALERRLGRVREIDRRLAGAAARSAAAVGLGGALGALLAGAAVVGVLAVGTPAVSRGLGGVLLCVLVLTPLAVFEALAGLPGAAAQVRAARPALGRVAAVLDAPDPAPDPPAPRRLPAAPYTLRLEGVAARWPGGPDVLSGLDLTLPPGHRLAVTGPSGAGKTTLALLLARFLDPVAGRVTLNGVDLRALAGDDVRRVVALVGDEAHCFDASIEANLRVARPAATDAELRGALARARLLDWVGTLPAGLATPVGEHGARLSGGQRRRLALARALLAAAPVLVLDEPTEHLDEPTARALTDDLLAAAAGRTIVLITHRPYGLAAVDEVLALPASPVDSSRCRKSQ